MADLKKVHDGLIIINININYDFLIIVQNNSKTGITVSTYAEIDVATLVT
jgi:hypothetical protein